MSAIEFHGVSQAFDGRPVLQELTFEVRQGETFALMGPSGTGKSTALLHIVGIHKPIAGRVHVMGVDITRLARERLEPLRRKIGFLFQSGALINWLNVFDNVALPLRETWRLGDAEVVKRVMESLARVGLEHDRDKFPSQLSGGMRKRVGLARAIVTRPEIVLYDEPTAGLDPAMSAQIENLILDLKKNLGVTSIVVTHDTQCASLVADRIAILSEGNIRAEGGRELLTSDNPWVTRFLGRPAAATGDSR
jgi:phospholipid/cholesterol/gamma-HCH transport system ATP-binding protein